MAISARSFSSSASSSSSSRTFNLPLAVIQDQVRCFAVWYIQFRYGELTFSVRRGG